jgi:hypothetical protein
MLGSRADACARLGRITGLDRGIGQHPLVAFCLEALEQRQRGVIVWVNRCVEHRRPTAIMDAEICEQVEADATTPKCWMDANVLDPDESVNPMHAVDHMAEHISDYLTIDLGDDQATTGEEKGHDSGIGEDI